MIKYLLLISVHIFTMSALFAQIDISKHNQIHINPFAYNIELHSSRITNIMQDSRGFMWFGTTDGLIKYDGNSITQYINNEDSSSVMPVFVIDMLADPDGTLWVLTVNEGLLKYNPEWDKFERFEKDTTKSKSTSKNYIRTIFRDSQHRLWVGTVNTGLCLVDEVNNSLIPVTNSNEFHTKDVFFIEEGKDGALLLDTGIPGAIVTYNAETKEYKKLIFSNEGISRTSFGISKSILYDSDGDIWIGTYGNGLFLLTNGQVLHYEQDVIGNDVVSDLLQDDDGLMWVATNSGGLAYFNKNTLPNNVIVLKHNTQDINTLVTNEVQAIYEGKDGLIWVGTHSKGLSILSKNSSGIIRLKHDFKDKSTLSNNNIRGIAEDKNGSIWVGTSGGGLNRLNNDFSFTRIQHDPENTNSIVGDMIVDVVADTQGDLWLGSFGKGFSIFSPSKHSFKNYMDGKGNLSKHSVWSTLHDNEDNTWIGTLSGLYYFDKENDEFIKCRNDGDVDFDNISVITLYQDRDQIVWVGTIQKGIGQLNREEKLINHYPLEGKELEKLNYKVIRSFYEDKQNRLWAATEGGLLLLKGEGAPKLYDENNGLPSNKVMGMLEDDHENLWISTQGGGLSKFNPTTEVFTNYNEEMGLQSMIFSKKSHFKTSNGLMIFGGDKGLNIFHPDSIRVDSEFPEVIFTGFKIFDEQITVGSVMDKHINLAKEITLNHEQSVFSVQFSALKFIQNKNIKYRYFIDGFDKSWRLSSIGNSATYTNLEPGTYTFKVKASNNQGEWGSSDYNLIINIIPPWWKTWWFKGLMVLIFVLILFFIDRYRIERYKKRKIELENLVTKRTVELKKSYDTVQVQNKKIKQTISELKNAQSQLIQSEKMASLGQLTAGIAHEINNPINFITAGTMSLTYDMDDLIKFVKHVEKIKGDDLQKIKDELDIGFVTENIQQTIKDIREGGDRTAEIVKELKTFSRLDDNNFKTVDIHKGIDSTLVLLHSKLNNNNITLVKNYFLTIKIEGNMGQLNQVFMNMLTNAIQAMKGKGVITITTRDEGENVSISIKDSGPGIPLKIRKKIFDPFFTTKDVGEGTGLGLSISYGIIEKHKGEIDLICEEGCEFIIKLPKKQNESGEKTISKTEELNQEQS